MSPMNNRLLVPQKLPLLLDYAPGAAAAYSLRSLSNSYVGPVVTVRRSTDSAERDFTATEVSDNTLTAWCGGGDGFVKQWWSQTGSNHASNSTTTQQPKVVASGVVVTEGGKAALSFDGGDALLGSDASFPSGNAARSIFVVAATSSSATMTAFAYGTRLSYRCFFFGANNGLTWQGFYSNDATGTADIRQFASRSLIFAGTQLDDRLNGATSLLRTGLTPASTDTLTGGEGFSIGRLLGQAMYWNGTISELIVYPTDMTALRTRIEADMAWYY